MGYGPLGFGVPRGAQHILDSIVRVEERRVELLLFSGRTVHARSGDLLGDHLVVSGAPPDSELMLNVKFKLHQLELSLKVVNLFNGFEG